MKTNKHPLHPAEQDCEVCKKIVKGGKSAYQKPDYGLIDEEVK